MNNLWYHLSGSEILGLMSELKGFANPGKY